MAVCTIVACRTCSPDGLGCLQCFDSFVRTSEGTCYLPYEYKLNIFALVLVGLIIAIFVVGASLSFLSNLGLIDEAKPRDDKNLSVHDEYRPLSAGSAEVGDPFADTGFTDMLELDPDKIGQWNKEAIQYGLKSAWRYTRFLDWSDDRARVLHGGRRSSFHATSEENISDELTASTKYRTEDKAEERSSISSLRSSFSLLREASRKLSWRDMFSFDCLFCRGLGVTCLLCCRRKRKEKTSPPRRYSWFVQVHFEFIVGVGLPLFYNFHFLPALAAIFATIATYGSIRLADCDFAVGFAEKLSAQATDECLEGFARIFHRALGALWMVLLFTSWLVSWLSRVFTKRFEKENSSMEDFAIRLRGLPSMITSEETLRGCIESIVEAIGLQGSDMVGVSIGYDLTSPDVSQTVWDMMERLLIRRDISLENVGDHEYKMGSCESDDTFMHKSFDSLKANWPSCFRCLDRTFWSDKVNWPSGYSDNLAWTAGSKPECAKISSEDDQEAFNKMQKEHRLKGSGRAFVVFHSKDKADYFAKCYRGCWVDLDLNISTEEGERLKSALTETGILKKDFQLSHRYDDGTMGGERLPRGTRVTDLIPNEPGAETDGFTARVAWLLEVDRKLCEPPSILWFNMGTPKATRQWRIVKATMFTFCLSVLLQYLILVPMNNYLEQPYALAHATIPFLTQQLVGISVGIVIQISNFCMWIRSWLVGFWHVHRVDVIIIIYNVVISVSATFFWVYPTILPYAQGFLAVSFHGDKQDREQLADALEKESELSDVLFRMFVPAYLFSNFLIGQILGRVWPQFLNWLLTRIIFVWRCLPPKLNWLLSFLIPWNPQPPKITARQAELVFSPPELSLAWDYGPLIVNPMACFLLLFMVSPRMWVIFPWMFVWVIFMYVYHRYGLLRLSKKRIFSSTHDRRCANYLWGLPLSIVLAAWAFWGGRLGIWGWRTMTPTAFMASLLIYWYGLWQIGKCQPVPLVEEDDPYDEVARRLVYDWFNTNPVYVLKCNYCPEDIGEEQIKAPHPFQFGKEYHLLERNSSKSLAQLQQEQHMPQLQRDGSAGSALRPRAFSLAPSRMDSRRFTVDSASFPHNRLRTDSVFSQNGGRLRADSVVSQTGGRLRTDSVVSQSDDQLQRWYHEGRRSRLQTGGDAIRASDESSPSSPSRSRFRIDTVRFEDAGGAKPVEREPQASADTEYFPMTAMSSVATEYAEGRRSLVAPTDYNRTRLSTVDAASSFAEREAEQAGSSLVSQLGEHAGRPRDLLPPPREAVAGEQCAPRRGGIRKPPDVGALVASEDWDFAASKCKEEASGGSNQDLQVLAKDSYLEMDHL